jgi:hypothetical protein
MIQHELLQFLDKTEQILIGWLRLELANSDDRGQMTEYRIQRTKDRNWKISIRYRTLTFGPVHYALCHSP